MENTFSHEISKPTKRSTEKPGPIARLKAEAVKLGAKPEDLKGASMKELKALVTNGRAADTAMATWIGRVQTQLASAVANAPTVPIAPEASRSTSTPSNSFTQAKTPATPNRTAGTVDVELCDGSILRCVGEIIPPPEP